MILHQIMKIRNQNDKPITLEDIEPFRQRNDEVTGDTLVYGTLKGHPEITLALFIPKGNHGRPTLYLVEHRNEFNLDDFYDPSLLSAISGAFRRLSKRARYERKDVIREIKIELDLMNKHYKDFLDNLRAGRVKVPRSLTYMYAF